MGQFRDTHTVLVKPFTSDGSALAMMGMEVGAPRAPRLPLPENERAELADTLRGLGLLAATNERQS